MLRLTRKVDYGLLLLAALARAGVARPHSARELAADLGLPRALVANLLKSLARAGLLRAARGARGGYRLARPLARVSLRDVLGATAGPLRLTGCAGGAGGTNGNCRLAAGCALRAKLGGVQRQIDRLLAGVTLAGLAGPARSSHA